MRVEKKIDPRDGKEYVWVYGAEEGIKWMNLTGARRTDPSNGRVVNNDGDRNFAVDVEGEVLAFFEDEGAKIKTSVRKDPETHLPVPDAEEKNSIRVKVVFGSQWYPCDIFLANDETRKMIRIPDDSVGDLDHMRFSKVSLQLREYNNSFGSTSLYLRRGIFSKIPDVDIFDGEYEGYQMAGDEVAEVPDPLKSGDNANEDEIPFV